ncbi:MAG TPA: S-methyl-5'-thioadenosine phosphorylase [Acidimicrobiia bacterium]|nr:S-methyl-5'-thioadenosine phosphorylase [Acidimicrobiia bacterium]
MRAEIGVFGGSGFYTFADDAQTVELETPFGMPSAPVSITEIGGRSVAFLPRHGTQHEYAPAKVPARANLWAFRMLGVAQVIGPCAAGSLSPEIHPGDFVVLDQLVDRTWGRPDTYYDRGNTHHVSYADPYCAAIAGLAADAGERCGVTMHRSGTVVVIPGPRFSTRAESHWYRAQGWHTVNMTQYPEAYLARELGMHYCGIALITDYDTGVVDDETVTPVTQAEVFAFFESNIHHVRNLLHELIPALPSKPEGCTCVDAAGPLEIFG